jgi:hypothetical protein
VKAGHYGDFEADITTAVLEEAGRFATDVLAPLNRVGDEHGIKLEAGLRRCLLLARCEMREDDDGQFRSIREPLTRGMLTRAKANGEQPAAS